MAKKMAPLFTWRSALCDSDLPSTTRHVALALSLYMNERGGSAYPGISHLVHDTALSESTCRDHLGRLVREGWLVLVEQGGRKGQRLRANLYEARIPPHATPPAPGGVGPRGGIPDPTARPGASDGATPPAPGGVPHRETASTPPGAGPQLTRISPEENPGIESVATEPSSSSDRHGEEEDRGDLDQRLVDVWPLLAETKLRLRTAPKPITNRAAWLAKVASDDELKYFETAQALIADRPSITAEQLAHLLAGGDDLAPETCPVCHGDFMITSPAGAVPCPRCNRAATLDLRLDSVAR